jgi:hypothetical protein
MKILFAILLLLYGNCFIHEVSQANRHSNNDFEYFVNLFKQVDLPLSLDRKYLFDCSKLFYDQEISKYRYDMFVELSEDFKNFIPDEILGNHPINQFRCLFVLPKHKDQYQLLIAKDFFEENEQYKLMIYLINYNNNGSFLSFLEVAGYRIDFWESFVMINEDFNITIMKYQFIENDENKYSNLFYMKESISICGFNPGGDLDCEEKPSRLGYFEGVIEGYNFVTY